MATLTIEKLTEILAKPGYVFSGMSPADLVSDTEKATVAVRAIVARYPQKERGAVAEQITALLTGRECDRSLAKPLSEIDAEPVQLSLLDLIDLINSEHQKCEQAFGEMLLHAKKTGEYLTQAKAMVPHGGWLEWVKENCKFSHKTANRYVQIFKGWEDLSNSSCMTNLSLNQALAVLAGDKESPEAEDVFEGELLPPAEPEAPRQVSPSLEPETPENTIPTQSNPEFLPGDSIRVISSPIKNDRLVGKEGYVVQILTNGNPLLRITGEQYEVSLPAECCELIKGSVSRPPAPEPAKTEDSWPMQYRQRVKLVDAPENYTHWRGLIGSEGYVVKCSQQKDKSWTITVKIDGEQWPAVLSENCWMELDYEPQPQPAALEPVALTVLEEPPLMARSGSDEHYTPEILWRPGLVAWEKDAYDLDPASNSETEPHVPANRVFTIETNGLARDWVADLLFCNPPFSLNTEFVEKLISELELGHIRHAIFLAKCDCRTAWFEALCANCNAACLVHQSVTFHGSANGSFFGVVLFYFGDDAGLFYRSHQHLGTVMQAMVPGLFGE